MTSNKADGRKHDITSVKRQKLLVLDLDETLVYAAPADIGHPADFLVGDYHVYQRPWLQSFLENLANHFRLGIWSSAGETYVETMIRCIQPPGFAFDFVWACNKCSYKRIPGLDEFVYEKRLSKLKRKGYSLEEILIIDDTPEKVQSNYGNAIYVKPFTGDMQDNELILLQRYLLTLLPVTNIRSVEKRNWRQTLH
jgi:RNA polymerase II subunit A small phosphatase-like protein